jgi:hypothetical protein
LWKSKSAFDEREEEPDSADTVERFAQSLNGSYYMSLIV